MRVRKDAAERKQEIVETILKLADSVGPDRLTTEKVAQAIGLSQPAIFRHFPSKQDMWLAVADRIAAHMRGRWARAQEKGGPEERIRALVDGQFELIQSMPALPAILFSRELHAGNDALRQFFYALMLEFHGTMTGLVAEGSRSGRFRPDLDPAEAASLIIALIQGLALRWSLSGRSVDLRAQGNHLLDLQLRGFIQSGKDAS